MTTWTCAVCSTQNRAEEPACTVCHAARPTVPVVTATPAPGAPPAPVAPGGPPSTANAVPPSVPVAAAPVAPAPTGTAPAPGSGSTGRKVPVGVAVAVVVVVLAAAAGLVVALGGGGSSQPDAAVTDAPVDDASAAPETSPPATDPPTTVATTAPPTTTTLPPLVALAVEESPASQAAVDTFTTYFQGLNDGDFEKAHSALSAAKQQKLSVEKMRSGADTSHDTDIVIESVDQVGDTVTVVLSFASTQSIEDSQNGDTCTRWRMRYELVPSGGGWGIDRVSGADGGDGWSDC